MLSIWRWDIDLPPGLEFLGGPVFSSIATAVFWIAAAALTRVVIFAFLRWLTRQTETDIDDVIMDATDPPLFALILLLGMRASLGELGLHAGWVDRLAGWLVVGVIAVVTYWVWQLTREVVLYYGQRLAEQSESSLDDVLLPIMNHLAPVVIFIGGAAVALQYLGVDLSALLVAIGGASFVLAFALQDILSNIFSGLSLVVDTPFGYHDLIQLGDGTLCEVRRIGLRVTELYNVNSHSVIYMPNAQLANERLVNITRPSPDLIDSLEVTVGAESDVARVTGILHGVVYGHPDLLGPVGEKLAHLDAFVLLESGDAKRRNGCERLKLEAELDRRLVALSLEFDRLVRLIRKLERGGLDQGERQEIAAAFQPIMRGIGLREATVRGARGKPQEVIEYNHESDSVIGATRAWVTLWASDPDLNGDEDSRLEAAGLWGEALEEIANDQQLLVRQWNRRTQLLIHRVTRLRAKIADPRGVEQRLDDMVRGLQRWIRENYKEPTPDWKSPDVNFTNFSEAGLSFSLKFFIDDIELEHFERQERVERELRAEILRRFREAGIQIPTPTQVVWMQDAHRVNGGG